MRKTDKETRRIRQYSNMHHPESCTDGLYFKKKSKQVIHFLQIAATYIAKIINIAEYRNTKYEEKHSVDIIQRQESNQQNTNLTTQQKI